MADVGQLYPVGWVTSITGTLNGCEEAKAAPGAGLRHYITSVEATNSSGVNGGVVIGAGEGTGGGGSAVETILLGPIYMLALTGFFFPLKRPIALPADKALTVDTTTSSAATVVITGYTAP